MRFHCLGIPHAISNDSYISCAYTQKVVKFCKMMFERGYTVYHYGHEHSSVTCTEHVTVVTDELFKKYYGYDHRNRLFDVSCDTEVYRVFHENSVKEINKRKKSNDFVLAFWGIGVKPVCDQLTDVIVVEPGIGYTCETFARFKIYESYAVMNTSLALHHPKTVISCDFYNVVIPNYFDSCDFIYTPEHKKDDFFLFIGRLVPDKGVYIAIDLANKLKIKLKVAGQGNIEGINSEYVEFIGYLDKESRKEMLSRAKCAILPSLYNEPFGGVQIECLLSGTPTITTDFGAFTENNIHGLTGYRCSTFGQFTWAVQNIHKIKSATCRKWGEKFLLENVAPMYEEYFQNVMNIYTGDGWYTNKDPASVDWMNTVSLIQ